MTVFVTRKLPSSVLGRLRAVADVDVYSGDAAIPPADLHAAVAGADALICLVTDRIDASIIEAARGLKVIASIGLGCDNVDVAAATARGVVVTDTRDVVTESVADFTWALILSVTRRIGEGERLVRRGAWKGSAFDRLLGTSLRGRQLGLVGFGRVGRAVAAHAPVFGMKVACTTRRALDAPQAESMSLDRLLLTSDVVSLHVPLTDETRHLIDKRALTRMKRSAYLINTSRGAIVEEEALAWALQQHLLAGAALDVYEHEPAVHAELLKLENALLAPHLGSATTETRTAMADLAVENVLAVLAGRPPFTPVTPP